MLITYVSSSPDHVLDASKVFVTYSLVTCWSMTLQFLPMGVSFVGQTIVSLQRIRDFLLLEEADTEAVQVDEHAGTMSLVCTPSYIGAYIQQFASDRNKQYCDQYSFA